MLFFSFFQPVHDSTLDWSTNPEGWLSRFQDSNWKVSDLRYLRCFPSKKPNFHFKRQTDLPPSLSLSFLFSSALLLRPLSCSMSLEEGRLHKSVTQEIPTLYFLSDKEPVMGDEFVAAGGFDRLGGNNKAISACQRSRRTEREKHTRGRYKSLVWWLQFFLFGGEMRQLNCTERWVAWPEHSCGVEITQWPHKDVL